MVWGSCCQWCKAASPPKVSKGRVETTQHKQLPVDNRKGSINMNQHWILCIFNIHIDSIWISDAFRWIRPAVLPVPSKGQLGRHLSARPGSWNVQKISPNSTAAQNHAELQAKGRAESSIRMAQSWNLGMQYDAMMLWWLYECMKQIVTTCNNMMSHSLIS